MEPPAFPIQRPSTLGRARNTMAISSTSNVALWKLNTSPCGPSCTLYGIARSALEGPHGSDHS